MILAIKVILFLLFLYVFTYHMYDKHTVALSMSLSWLALGVYGIVIWFILYETTGKVSRSNWGFYSICLIFWGIIFLTI